MKKVIFIFAMLLMSYFCNAQEVDVNGMYIGQIYSREEFVAKFGEPDYAYPSKPGEMEQIYRTGCGWCEHCNYGHSEFKFDVNDKGQFRDFDIRDKGFVVMNDFRKGGFKIGDVINDEIIRQTFPAEGIVIEKYGSGCWKIYLGDWAHLYIGSADGKLVSISFEIMD